MTPTPMIDPLTGQEMLPDLETIPPIGGISGADEALEPMVDEDEAALEAPSAVPPASGSAYPDAIDKKNIRGLTGERLEKIGREITRCVEEAERSLTKRRGWMREWRKVFELIPPPKKGQHFLNAANIRTPSTRNACETIVARLISILFEQPPFVKVTPANPETDGEAARKIQTFLTEMLSPPRYNLVLEMIKALKNWSADGCVIGKSCWRHEVRRVRRREILTPRAALEIDPRAALPSDPAAFPWVLLNGRRRRLGERYEVDREAVTENRFDLEHVPADQFVLWPPSARTIDEAAYVGHLVKKTPDQLAFGVKDGLYDKQAVRYLREKASAGTGTERRESYDQLQDAQGVDQKHLSTDEGGFLDLYEGVWQGRIDPDDFDELPEDYLVTVEMSTGRVLRFQRNPYHNGKRPFRDLTPDPRVGGGFWGYSVVEKLYDLQLVDDAVTNQALDAGTIALSSLMVIDEGGRRDPAERVWRPGLNVWRDGRDGTFKSFHQFPQIPASHFVNLDANRNLMFNVSAASEAAQGGATTQDRPLGETNILLNSSAIRLTLLVVAILDYLTWVVNQCRDYYLQMMDEEYSFVVTRNGKPEKVTITLEELGIDCTITAYSSSLDADKTLARQFAEKLFVALAQFPTVQADLGRLLLNLYQYARTIGGENVEPVIDEITGGLEEAKRMQMRLAEAQMAQQQQMSLMGGMSGVPGIEAPVEGGEDESPAPFAF